MTLYPRKSEAQKLIAASKQRNELGRFTRPPSSIPPTAQVDNRELFAGIPNRPTGIYRNPDKAYQIDQENASRMRFDLTIDECIEERKIECSQMKYDIIPPSEECQWQAEEIKAIIENCPKKTDLFLWLLEAIWFGRAAAVIGYRWEFSPNQRLVIDGWFPVHGDTLVFGDNDQVGIKIGVPTTIDMGENPIIQSQEGRARLIPEHDRENWIIHNYQIAAGEYRNPWTAGSMFGLGLRGKCYFAWELKNKLLADFVAASEEFGVGGKMVAYFDVANPASEAAMAESLLKQAGNYTLLLPRAAGQESAEGIEFKEPKGVGYESINSMIQWFDAQLRSRICGQKEANPKLGMGGDTTAMYADSFARKVRYDALALEETLTRDLVSVIARWNGFDGPFKFKFREEGANPQVPDAPEPLDQADEIRKGMVHQTGEPAQFTMSQALRIWAKAWNENEHDRADDGKFGSGGGGKQKSLFNDHEPTPEKKKVAGEFFDNPKSKQKTLLSGLDSLPGQQDLFDVDGVAEPREKAVKKITKEITGTQEMNQPRAKSGGEIGPNGEHYKGGAFIATQNLPKKLKAKIEKTATGKVQVDGTTWAVPEPGQMSILNKLGGTALNPRNGDINYQYLEWSKSSPEYVAAVEEVAERWKAGERWISVNDYPDLAGIKDAARLVVSGKPVPGAILDKMPPEWREHLTKYTKTPEPNQAARGLTRFEEEGRWITIGGGEGEGHARIQIDGKGNILKGPEGLAKDGIKSLDDFSKGKEPAEKAPDKEPPSRASSKDQWKENIKRAASDYEVDAGDLADAVDDLHKEKKQRLEEREKAKKALRETLGITAQDIDRLENAGHDYASDSEALRERFPKLAKKLAGADVYASELASDYPELELGDPEEDDVIANMFDRIREGKQDLPAKHDADLIDEAARRVKDAYGYERIDDNAPIPWSRRGQSTQFEEGKWITVNGAHVQVDSKGTVTKGPKALKGKKPDGSKAKEADKADKPTLTVAHLEEKAKARKKAKAKEDRAEKKAKDADAWKPKGTPSDDAKPPTGLEHSQKVFDIAKGLQDGTHTHADSRGDRFGNNKVFIGSVFKKFKEEHPNATREEFNKQLLGAHTRGEITLSRADLIGAMHPADVAESEVNHAAGYGQYHFLRTDTGRPGSQPQEENDSIDLTAPLDKPKATHDQSAAKPMDTPKRLQEAEERWADMKAAGVKEREAKAKPAAPKAKPADAAQRAMDYAEGKPAATGRVEKQLKDHAAPAKAAEKAPSKPAAVKPAAKRVTKPTEPKAKPAAPEKTKAEAKAPPKADKPLTQKLLPFDDAEKAPETERIEQTAFKGKKSGQVHKTGPIHTYGNVPEKNRRKEDHDAGFITNTGRFLTREEAADFVGKAKAKDKPHTLDSSEVLQDSLNAQGRSGERPPLSPDKAAAKAKPARKAPAKKADAAQRAMDYAEGKPAATGRVEKQLKDHAAPAPKAAKKAPSKPAAAKAPVKAPVAPKAPEKAAGAKPKAPPKPKKPSTRVYVPDLPLTNKPTGPAKGKGTPSFTEMTDKDFDKEPVWHDMTDKDFEPDEPKAKPAPKPVKAEAIKIHKPKVDTRSDADLDRELLPVEKAAREAGKNRKGILEKIKEHLAGWMAPQPTKEEEQDFGPGLIGKLRKIGRNAFKG